MLAMLRKIKKKRKTCNLPTTYKSGKSRRRWARDYGKHWRIVTPGQNHLEQLARAHVTRRLIHLPVGDANLELSGIGTFA